MAGRHARQSLTWSQRIGAAIGVAKGIQFLHTGIVPGLYSNNLKMTDILVDLNLVTKISSYSLPLLAEEEGKVPERNSLWLFMLLSVRTHRSFAAKIFFFFSAGG